MYALLPPLLYGNFSIDPCEILGINPVGLDQVQSYHAVDTCAIDYDFQIGEVAVDQIDA